MQYRVDTLNSTYEIDTDIRTWRRTRRSRSSGQIRTEEGVYNHLLGPALGSSMIFECPPVNAAKMRVVATSLVERIQELPNGTLKI